MPAQSYTHEVKPKTHVPTSRGDRPRGEIRVVVLPSSLATILVVAMTVVAMMVLVVALPTKWRRSKAVVIAAVFIARDADARVHSFPPPI